jgi:hypothetical protein
MYKFKLYIFSGRFVTHVTVYGDCLYESLKSEELGTRRVDSWDSIVWE